MSFFIGITLFILHFLFIFFLLLWNAFLGELSKVKGIFLLRLIFLGSIFPSFLFVIFSPLFLYIEYPFLPISDRYLAFLLGYGGLMAWIIYDSSIFKKLHGKIIKRLNQQ